jgi:hypothetical protein
VDELSREIGLVKELDRDVGRLNRLDRRVDELSREIDGVKKLDRDMGRLNDPDREVRDLKASKAGRRWEPLGAVGTVLGAIATGVAGYAAWSTDRHIAVQTELSAAAERRAALTEARLVWNDLLAHFDRTRWVKHE